MGTASGVDFEDARANVDRKLEAAKEGRQPVTEEDLSRDWPEEPVPVNELDAAALARAAGISSSLAAAVVEHRNEHGEFTSGPDLGRVSHRDREGLVKLATLADYRSGKK
jgi:DNA uptake protein ComE-like DNA-binding protein